MTTDKPDLDEARNLLVRAESEALAGISNDETLHAIAGALGDNLSKNANPFVPWSDSQIPFECDCGAIIYADTPHSHDG